MTNGFNESIRSYMIGLAIEGPKHVLKRCMLLAPMKQIVKEGVVQNQMVTAGATLTNISQLLENARQWQTGTYR